MENQNTSVMKVSDWFITIFITAIPIVGLIMLFVWGFGSNTNTTKANWAKAVLLWYAVMIVLYAFIAIIFGAAFLSGMSNFDTGY
jgi:heme/copper-type cytochrome/quinol oxidase subunit 2